MVDSARSSMRMVGIPEQGFNLWAARFIGAGHKIGRVEQMQTRTQVDRSGSKTAVVPRELCQVLTLGTITELDMLMDHTPHYLLAIKEISASYGIVIADTSRGLFRFAYLPEDDQRSALVTLLHSAKPKEVLLERGHISKVALTCIDKEISGVRKTFVTPKTEFPEIADAIKHFETEKYFSTEPVIESLQPFWDNELVMSAFGAMALYLRDSKQDRELLSMKNFGKYDPSMGGRALTLDGITLANLEVLESASGKGSKGTLLEYLDHCVWPVGKRKLHQWLCSPLRLVADIVKRQESVAELVENPEKRTELREFLRKLPDLERCLSRLGVAGREREVAWVDPVAYNKKIVALFIETLTAFKTVNEFITKFEGTVESSLLGSLTAFKEAGGLFPSYSEALANFENSFDSKKATLTGEVEPQRGAHEKYDAAVAEQAKIQLKLDEYLAGVKKHYKNAKGIKYVSLGKEHYMIEIPAAASGSAYPGFEMKSQTKTVKKYIARDISSLVSDMQLAKERVEAIKRTVLKDILLQFSEHINTWKEVINCLSDVDCLCSLAITSSVPGMCRPVVKEKDANTHNGSPYLVAKKVVHPLVRPAVGSNVDTTVANDIVLGGPNPAVSLITGPNMGGKSTVMRSACIVIIFTQLGCFVPASSVEMTPADRIFTRIGASDRILSGMSTFMVEMRETATILKHATHDSFVVLDELGRGTATVDGYSIAYAVLMDIAKRICCRTMFSTHYHFLCHDVLAMGSNLISLNKMAYEIDPATRSVTFLYKFISGATTESYGVDVAKKANIPSHILAVAQQRADAFRESNDFQGGVDVVPAVVKQCVEALRSGKQNLLDDARRKASSLLSMY
eukprot:TRINITY_DN2002_c0_g2_i2.p1 TRINITY_DN2002_c0_g2~~TRINITY_DN2002_c0_g2_i2.p1  ORF type:complete len:987 (+),score=368.56 TRINITY_DN2002_c0_g2_i2:405-2963(+)